jgi:CheY-like chemotaxis protein
MASRILVVDDDLYIRELYEEVLVSAGYEVATALDGLDGLNKIKAGGYDLIFLDMIMPKMDGLGILRELKVHKPEMSNGSIVLLSNLENEPVLQQAIEVGVAESMTKADITPDQLLACAEKYIVK